MHSVVVPKRRRKAAGTLWKIWQMWGTDFINSRNYRASALYHLRSLALFEKANAELAVLSSSDGRRQDAIVFADFSTLSALSQLGFVDWGALRINPDRKEEAGLQGRKYE
jgi:hypothetical protein